MWDFLNNILEKAGFVAVVYAGTTLGMGLAVRALWKRLELEREERVQLAAQVAQASAEKLAAVQLARAEEAEKRARMREAIEAELRDLVNERRREAREYAERLDTLHERRVQDSHAIVREAVEHIAATRGSVEKITTAMQTLERVIGGG